MQKNNLKNFDALGTTWSIHLYELREDLDLERLSNEVIKIVRTFEKQFSRFSSTSSLRGLCNKNGFFAVDEEFVHILQWYLKLSSITNNIFTPLIGQNLNEAGYDANYSFKHVNTLSHLPSLNNVIRILDKNRIEILEAIHLDFGGVGKGWLIDKIYDFLVSQKVTSFSVDGGGDIRHYDISGVKQGIQIGLENPKNLSEVIGVTKIQNMSICSSSGNRRNWGEFHHIINPIEKKSPDNVLATWVIASTALLADTLSTCLFLVEPSILKQHFNFDYVLIDSDSAIHYSDNFPVEFF